MMYLALALAANSASIRYDCVVNPVSTAVRILGQSAKSSPLEFKNMPSGNWKFHMQLTQGGHPQATIQWPTNPIEVVGKFPAFATSKSSFAFVAVRKPPCMFTNAMCLSLFHIVDQSDTSAIVAVTPAGLSTNDAGDKFVPFVPILQGNCARRSVVQ